MVMQPDDDLNDSWFDRPGRELRREDLPTNLITHRGSPSAEREPPPAPPSRPPEVVEERNERDSLADPWFV
jgi:hypothetical protein